MYPLIFISFATGVTDLNVGTAVPFPMRWFFFQRSFVCLFDDQRQQLVAWLRTFWKSLHKRSKQINTQIQPCTLRNLLSKQTLRFFFCSPVSTFEYPATTNEHFKSKEINMPSVWMLVGGEDSGPKIYRKCQKN